MPPRTLVKSIEQIYAIECSRCPRIDEIKTTGMEAPHLFASSVFRKDGWQEVSDFPVCPDCMTGESVTVEEEVSFSPQSSTVIAVLQLGNTKHHGAAPVPLEVQRSPEYQDAASLAIAERRFRVRLTYNAQGEIIHKQIF